jgi:hypothetical protein
MFINYFKIAWRNMVKNGSFSIINITGLRFLLSFVCYCFFISGMNNHVMVFTQKRPSVQVRDE